MAEGTIKRKVDCGFGFIATANGRELFFHMSSVGGTTFEALQKGQRVTYTEAAGHKGPRAEKIRPI
jgi:CspA family cold shock protein